MNTRKLLSFLVLCLLNVGLANALDQRLLIDISKNVTRREFANKMEKYGFINQINQYSYFPEESCSVYHRDSLEIVVCYTPISQIIYQYVILSTDHIHQGDQLYEPRKVFALLLEKYGLPIIAGEPDYLLEVINKFKDTLETSIVLDTSSLRNFETMGKKPKRFCYVWNKDSIIFTFESDYHQLYGEVAFEYKFKNENVYNMFSAEYHEYEANKMAQYEIEKKLKYARIALLVISSLIALIIYFIQREKRKRKKQSSY